MTTEERKNEGRQDRTAGQHNHDQLSLSVRYERAVREFIDEELEQAPDSTISRSELIESFQSWYHAVYSTRPPNDVWAARSFATTELNFQPTSEGQHLSGWEFSSTDG